MQDLQTTFCTNQPVGSVGTVVRSTDWIDGKIAQDWAGGHEPCIQIVVTAQGATGTSVTFVLEAVDLNGVNPVTIAQTPEITVANLPVGSEHNLKLTPLRTLPASDKSHLRLAAVSVGTTSLSISAQLLPDVGTGRPTKGYAAGF